MTDNWPIFIGILSGLAGYALGSYLISIDQPGRFIRWTLNKLKRGK